VTVLSRDERPLAFGVDEPAVIVATAEPIEVSAVCGGIAPDRESAEGAVRRVTERRIPEGEVDPSARVCPGTPRVLVRGARSRAVADSRRRVPRR